MARWEPILDEVMRERGSGLLAYARLLTGNDADAEDVLQDALVRSFSRGRTFTHVNAAEAYVRRAIPSVFIDRLRGRRTRDTALERRAREQDEAISMGDRDAVLDVRAALATLPARERACPSCASTTTSRCRRSRPSSASPTARSSATSPTLRRGWHRCLGTRTSNTPTTTTASRS